MFTILLTFIAGLLTALAPCVLPLLPVILGGSIDPKNRDSKRPYIITASLLVSLILFTILLKASTVLIGIDPKVWVYLSGSLVIVLGIFMLFPDLWAKIIGRLGIEHRSQSILGKAFGTKNKTISAILIGAALGPVFSSCSPTYAWVLATVLPSNTALGLFYLAIYCAGLATSLLAIALLGRKLLERVKWASNPKGWFQRIIAIMFILVGMSLITGWDKQVQTWLVDKDYLNLIQLEQNLVPTGSQSTSINTNSTSQFNVTPYDAPELKNIAAWINSDPLTIAGLKGKVVLIDFWTYSCINCQRTQPYLNAWYDKYNNDGLVIIGVHAPEFAFEKVTSNVQDAVSDEKIQYPVALDNDFSTWQAYQNQYWPAKYLIDKDGYVRYTHFGEGDYAETEGAIQALLKESGQAINATIESDHTTGTTVRGQTPETYLGFGRAERFANTDQFAANQPVQYTLVDTPKEHAWSLGGQWQVNDESSQSLSNESKLRINFSAKVVYLVMSGPPGASVGVSVDGVDSPGGTDCNTQNQVQIDGARLYNIVDLDTYMTKQQLTLTVPTGVTVHAFTFGG